MSAIEAPRPSAYRLRLPGPTTVPERVRQAMAQPVLNHRGPEFRAILRETGALARDVFRTSNDVLFMAGSGTGAMEASLVNVLAPHDRVLVAINGQFGERFAAIASALGARVDRLEASWGQTVEAAAIAERLAEQDYRAVLVTHNESSTGAAADLAAIGAAVRDSAALLVVDAVSSLGGLELHQDAWHLDVVVSASQKALMCPPGLSLISASPKAWAVIERDGGLPRYYWDLRKARLSMDKDETPFTPPVSLLAGLREALRMIHEEGLARVLERHRRLSAALRAGGMALGLPIFTDLRNLSDTVVVFGMPEGLEGGAVVRRLYDRYRTVVGGARNQLAGKVVRIGTMGFFDAEDVLTDLLHLEGTLRDLGRPAPCGAGLAAAAAVLGSPPEVMP